MKRMQLNIRVEQVALKKLQRIRKLWPGETTPSVSAVVRAMIDKTLADLEKRK